MSVTHRTRFLLLFAAALAMVTTVPALAEAQRRVGPRRISGRVVVVRAYTYPRWYYDPWFQWGPYGRPYPYPYGYGAWDGLTASLKLEVKPRDAEVFVDGYRAGVVDDFDGVFQRLRVRPGGHEITVYFPGYRTVTRAIYSSAGSDQKIRFDMEPLAAGDVSEPPPTPDESRTAGRGAASGAMTGEGDGIDREPADDDAPPRQAAVARAGEFGTLSLRVQPADAEIFVDGERWDVPESGDRVTIQLSEGRHHVEVRRAGYRSYEEDVLIRRRGILTLNVGLSSDR